MKTKTPLNFLAVTWATLLAAQSAPVAPPAPLVHAHAHNDYAHKRPLLDALDHGFCSVEADIFLVDGQLLVAHGLRQVKPERTLQALYLDPLRDRVKANAGRVFQDGPGFTLLIDLKSRWTNTYPVLRSVLTNYADILTAFRDGTKRAGAITVIITGNRSKAMFAGEDVRFACLDGAPADANPNTSADLVPWISADWKTIFTWNGEGPMPDADHRKMVELVQKAHQQGQQVRFWGAPDKPTVWQALRDADVDLINTDDLDGLEKFLRGQKKS